MKNKIPIFLLLFLLSFVLEASADIIYLKNGRTMQGKIKKQNEDGVWLDVGAGTVKFTWEQIENIDAPGFEPKRSVKPKPKKEFKPKDTVEKPRDILLKAEDFSVIGPSDWKNEVRDGALMLKGPALTVAGDMSSSPFILIKKETDEAAIRSSEKTKEYYYRWKELPAVKDKMLTFMMNIYTKTHNMDDLKIVSCDSGERGGFITQNRVTLNKERKVKLYDAGFITKDSPTRAYVLVYMCPEEYYESYFPVFEKCLESFSLDE